MTDAAALPGRPRGGVLSGPATARAINVLAPNPSAMTLDGTNTWIVSEPDSELAVVIDPGPLDDTHLKTVIATVEKAGKRIALTLLTHGHPDHAVSAARFAALTRTSVRALDPALRLGDEGLAAGDVITTGGLDMRVVPTPGHTADSLCFHLPADRAVLTGDTVLGRGTTVVAHPDGLLRRLPRLAPPLRSLTVDDGVHTILPGHGAVLEDAQGAVEFYLAHRAHRLAQVETAVENGHRAPSEVVAQVYAAVDRSLWPHGRAVGTRAARIPAGTRPDLVPRPAERAQAKRDRSQAKRRAASGRQVGRRKRPFFKRRPFSGRGSSRGPEGGPWRGCRPVSASASRDAPRPAGSPRAPPGAASRAVRSRRAPC